MILLTHPSLLLALAAFLPPSAAPQALPRMPLDHAPALTVLKDDDDGRVEIIPPGAPASPARQFHGGAVIKAPRVSTLFLGSAWQAPSHSGAMKHLTAGLVGFGVSERFAALKTHGLSAFSFPVAEEGVVPFPAEPLSDLGVQHFLHQALRQGRLAAPTADSLVVVFLAPGQQLTLGGHPAGEAFLAYHSAYQDEAGRVRYVVVPFGTSVAATARAAEQAVTAAILNPDGDAWY